MILYSAYQLIRAVSKPSKRLRLLCMCYQVFVCVVAIPFFSLCTSVYWVFSIVQYSAMHRYVALSCDHVRDYYSNLVCAWHGNSTPRKHMNVFVGIPVRSFIYLLWHGRIQLILRILNLAVQQHFKFHVYQLLTHCHRQLSLRGSVIEMSTHLLYGCHQCSEALLCNAFSRNMCDRYDKCRLACNVCGGITIVLYRRSRDLCILDR